MTEPDRLVEEHRAHGILVDTNLLVLLMVGSVDRRRIATHNRLQAYTAEDFDLLARLLDQFRLLYTTPHVLTEVSNLAILKSRELELLRASFRIWVEEAQEITEQSRNVVQRDVFSKLGLADSAIVGAARGGLLVLTDDGPLFGLLRAQNLPAINFNYLRAWN